jgi:hypothetical protein
METPEKNITPEKLLAWLLRSQERKRELQEQFQKDCESGKVDRIIQNSKPIKLTP